MIESINRESEKLYATRGSYANNTTIPDCEKSMIAGQVADAAEGQQDRYKLAGEQAMVSLFAEYGLVPRGRVYTDFEEICPVEPKGSGSQKPFPEIFGTDRGRLSKSLRNLRVALGRKNRALR